MARFFLLLRDKSKSDVKITERIKVVFPQNDKRQAKGIRELEFPYYDFCPSREVFQSESIANRQLMSYKQSGSFDL